MSDCNLTPSPFFDIDHLLLITGLSTARSGAEECLLCSFGLPDGIDGIRKRNWLQFDENLFLPSFLQHILEEERFRTSLVSRFSIIMS